MYNYIKSKTNKAKHQLILLLRNQIHRKYNKTILMISYRMCLILQVSKKTQYLKFNKANLSILKFNKANLSIHSRASHMIAMIKIMMTVYMRRMKVK
jgi:hypothetical protein